MNELEKSMELAMAWLREQVRQELTDQGHVATGRLINSIEIRTSQDAEGVTGQLWVEDYGVILEYGVAPHKVPYTPGSGKGTSKYITALIDWIGVIKPGLAVAEKKSFAFAIAKTAKREGHPTKGSFAYSVNGRRKAWAETVFGASEERFITMLNLDKYMAVFFDNAINDIQKTTI